MSTPSSSSRFRSPQPNADATGGLGWQFWMLVVPVGVGAGTAAGVLMRLLRIVQRLAWPDAGGGFLGQVEASSWLHRVVVLIAAGLVVTAVGAVLNLRPGGHGGELAAAIWFRAGRLPVWRTLVKSVTSIVIVGMGASLGREAAPKQVGALLAWLLSHWTGLPARQRRLLSACGAGAGIAAVYNVPLGGALFALEVLLGTLALPLIPPALCTASIATVTAWLFLPDEPTYDIGFQAASPSLLAFAVLAGPVAGVASAGFIRLIAWVDTRRPAGAIGLAAPVLVFAAIGVLSIPYPELLGNGRSEVQLAFSGSMPLLALAALAALKPFATAASIGSGAPGGLFTPTLTIGAALGGALGYVWGWFVPSADRGSCAILVAGALLAASTAGPLSALVLILELTHHVDSVLAPLVLAVAGAVATGRLLDIRSIYTARIHLPASADASVSTAMRLPQLARALIDHAALTVVDEHGQTVGRIDRQLLAAADCRLDAIATARDIMRPNS